MPGLVDIAGDQPVQAYWPGNATAGSAKESAIGRAPFRGKITAVEFVPSAAITGAVTNNFTLNVRNRTTAGVGTAIPATITFGSGTNGVAQAPVSLTLSATATDLLVNAGDVITAEKAVNGTGLAAPDGEIIVHYQSF